jgi:hypothetical protein
MSPSMPPKDESGHSKGDDPAFGWTSYAEKINGRFAMVGLIGLLVLEVLTRQDFLTWLGLR